MERSPEAVYTWRPPVCTSCGWWSSFPAALCAAPAQVVVLESLMTGGGAVRGALPSGGAHLAAGCVDSM